MTFTAATFGGIRQNILNSCAAPVVPEVDRSRDRYPSRPLLISQSSCMSVMTETFLTISDQSDDYISESESDVGKLRKSNRYIKGDLPDRNPEN